MWSFYARTVGACGYHCASLQQRAAPVVSLFAGRMWGNDNTWYTEHSEVDWSLGNPDTCGITVALSETIRTPIEQPASQPASLLTAQQ